MDAGNKGRCIKDVNAALKARRFPFSLIARDTERWSFTLRPSLLSFSPGRLITDTHNVSDAQDVHFTE